MVQSKRVSLKVTSIIFFVLLEVMTNLTFTRWPFRYKNCIFKGKTKKRGGKLLSLFYTFATSKENPWSKSLLGLSLNNENSDPDLYRQVSYQ